MVKKQTEISTTQGIMGDLWDLCNQVTENKWCFFFIPKDLILATTFNDLIYSFCVISHKIASKTQACQWYMNAVAADFLKGLQNNIK